MSVISQEKTIFEEGVCVFADKEVPLESSFWSAEGKIPYGFQNDYMFKVAMGACEPALKALICALLHLDQGKVYSVKIENPIEPGEAVDAKDMRLDIKVLFDDNTYLNMEMQVAKQDFWPERSLAYLCRTYDHLKEGESYTKIKPAIHIGFIDFNLFEHEPPEFYATYHLANDKTHHIYTEKFTLAILNLREIETATPEDIQYGIDYWARLFKATTWEEIQMLAKGNNAIAEAAQKLYELSDDNLVRERCYARQEHYREIQGYHDMIEEGKRENARIKQTYEDMLEEKDDLIARLQAQLAERKSE